VFFLLLRDVHHPQGGSIARPEAFLLLFVLDLQFFLLPPRKCVVAMPAY